jgi:hypothetical protein
MTLMLLSMGMSNCSGVKYAPPEFEDCTVLTEWSQTLSTDVASCFCVNHKLRKDKYADFVGSVESVFNQHPLRESVVSYLLLNQETILKKKEYELPISYCRGYSSVGPSDRSSLIRWAENNRLKRIECELELRGK